MPATFVQRSGSPMSPIWERLEARANLNVWEIQKSIGEYQRFFFFLSKFMENSWRYHWGYHSAFIVFFFHHGDVAIPRKIFFIHNYQLFWCGPSLGWGHPRVPVTIHYIICFLGPFPFIKKRAKLVRMVS
jgi:hypothetical protein